MTSDNYQHMAEPRQDRDLSTKVLLLSEPKVSRISWTYGPVIASCSSRKLTARYVRAGIRCEMAGLLPSIHKFFSKPPIYSSLPFVRHQRSHRHLTISQCCSGKSVTCCSRRVEMLFSKKIPIIRSSHTIDQTKTSMPCRRFLFALLLAVGHNHALR